MLVTFAGIELPWHRRLDPWARSEVRTQVLARLDVAPMAPVRLETMSGPLTLSGRRVFDLIMEGSLDAVDVLDHSRTHLGQPDTGRRFNPPWHVYMGDPSWRRRAIPPPPVVEDDLGTFMGLDWGASPPVEVPARASGKSSVSITLPAGALEGFAVERAGEPTWGWPRVSAKTSPVAAFVAQALVAGAQWGKHGSLEPLLRWLDGRSWHDLPMNHELRVGIPLRAALAL